MSINKSVVILAGGLGSRYKGLKQIDGILENGATIMEYSIYDAIQAGFNKIVIIINEHIPIGFCKKLDKIFQNKAIEIHWVTQTLSCFVPKHISIESRIKPWGTAHAILCAKNVIQEPFIVLNADDFYGNASFLKAAHIINQNSISEKQWSLMAYPVKNTLSKNGPVARGVCSIGMDGFLLKIEEKTTIEKKNDAIIYSENNTEIELNPNTLVSMNFWILHPGIFPFLEKLFADFLVKFKNQEEFYIPNAIQQLIETEGIKVDVKASPSEWKGVTFAEDKSEVQDFLKAQIQQQKYPEQLW